jgi:hypothetical protein
LATPPEGFGEKAISADQPLSDPIAVLKKGNTCVTFDHD